MTYISKVFVTVDIVVFKQLSEGNQILLIKRKNEPFKDCWALPGGFVDENEDLEVAAKRELLEETTVGIEKITQIKAYGKPFRDPRSHMVTVAFYGEVAADIEGRAADDAKELAWFSVRELPELAFDHAEIVADAIDLYKKR